MMRSVVIRNHGNVEDVVKIEELPIRKPGPGEVLVRVYAAGMNPANYKIVEGKIGSFSPKLPSGDGMDVSGEVVEVGLGVSRFIEGDMVWGMQRVVPFQHLIGTFAEFVLMNEKNLFRKPVEISHIEAASLGVVAFTGVQALVETAKLEKNQKVLIIGGSGGTGTYAVQLAKNVIGAYVAVTCSSRNVALMRLLGADRIINYQKEDWGKVLRGEKYDVIYDCRGGETHWEDAQYVLKSSGRFVTIVGDSADQKTLTVSQLASIGGSIAVRKFSSFFGGPNYDYVMPSPTLIQYQAITKWMVSGKTKAVIDKVFEFDNIVEAYQYQKSGRAVGKIVVSMITYDEDSCPSAIRPHLIANDEKEEDNNQNESSPPEEIQIEEKKEQEN